MKKIFMSLAAFCLTLPLYAQFVVNGNESAFTKWNTFKTNAYQFIYPAGCDSLAYSYAHEWEKYRLAVGYKGGDNLPVVLHPYSATSNGFVVWTPRRMEMFTAPSMYSPEPVPWHTLLAIHENRHVSQMQFLRLPPFRWTERWFGELLAGPLCTLYSTSMFMEGDAVAAETAITSSGRGRSADFLEYFRVCFENDDLRDFDRWRFGSQKYYTPDYYKIGYLTVAGMGLGPHDEFFDNTLRPRFHGFAREMQQDWQEDTRSRAPFQPYSELTKDESFYVSYSGLVPFEGKIYAVKAGLADNARIVSLDPATGKVRKSRLTSADSRLIAGDGKLYWTEEIPDLRWEVQSTSELRSLKGSSIRTEIGGRRLYNPAYEAGQLALVENMTDGSCYVRVYETAGMMEVASYRAPSGLQVLEPVWVNGHLFASAMNDEGQLICDVEDGFEVRLASSPVAINHLSSEDGKVVFTSDRTGVNEMYSLDVQSGVVCQLTNLPQGGRDFVFSGDSLYFTVLSPLGRNICVTHRSALPVREVDFSKRHSYKMADSLSRNVQREWINEKFIRIDAPRKYTRNDNRARVHSYIPFLYLDTDELLTISSEQLYMDAGLGATFFFQNNLSTFSGSAGLKYNFFDEYDPTIGFGANMTYRGLYPVFELRTTLTPRRIYGNLRSYIPLNFSRNGWSTGVIPMASFEFLDGVQDYAVSKTWVLRSVTSLGVRAYTILPKRNSNIFPRLGIGAYCGADYHLIFDDKHRPQPRLSLYGYLPGVAKTHGIAWNASTKGNYIFTKDTYTIDVRNSNLSVRYGLPFAFAGSSAFSPLFYFKNLELIPFYEFERDDYLLQETGYKTVEMRHSFGSYVNIVLGNLFCLPYDFRLGVKCGYNTSTGMFCNLALNYDL